MMQLLENCVKADQLSFDVRSISCVCVCVPQAIKQHNDGGMAVVSVVVIWQELWKSKKDNMKDERVARSIIESI